jgi:flagellar basal body-associated protein FliL
MKSKKNLAVLLIVIILILLGVWLSSTATSLVKNCEEIKTGQSQERVEQAMSKYFDLDGVLISRKESGVIPLQPQVEYEEALGIYTTSLMDDVQCNIYFMNDKVAHVEIISD